MRKYIRAFLAALAALAVFSIIDGIFYGRESVNHCAGEYVCERVTTNSIESVWTVMKHELQGVYYCTSDKHLARYVNEFSFRLNDGDVKRRTLERLASLVMASFGPHITYKELIA